ncbi:hypothetical protein ACPW99_03815 [Klebsiella pneumoniae]|uniref:hypothetical protein n=1 Tax=Klebsiella pneumoniae complex TaxID=3390273 RepID=UPI0010128776|nr:MULTISPECIES: hypothetical protein [Klebsiella]EFC1505974.1 hypothetical protein [Escherichia coli]HDT2425312.1 hypothetical protein [Klebsiella variicola]EIY7235987.1 hypothetical protein [Escherichia coli]EKT9408124.1 hypothetical protein [Klebsiella pneumoniae]EKZ5231635.1 hypothetical protein [Klebsiella pneumoniae]
MNVTFDQETYRELIYEANLQGLAAPALVARIIRQYIKNQTGPYEGANQPEENNEQKRTTISGN